MTKINLRDTTFIIPIRIESDDRLFNFEFVLAWLQKHLDTNIIVHEDGHTQIGHHVVNRHNNTENESNGNILYSFTKNPSRVFHRTRILNDMLCRVTTPYVVNYDADVLLLPHSYFCAVQRLREGADLVYPYSEGEFQREITPAGKEMLSPDCDLMQIPHRLMQARCGHAQFFRTETYVLGGMENENFISYGAEDVERMLRFQKRGDRVEWLNGGDIVFHIEHSRGQNSSTSNPHFEANDSLFRMLAGMNVEELKKYYLSQPYAQKYAPLILRKK